jgi:hypothetical protein
VSSTALLILQVLPVGLASGFRPTLLVLELLLLGGGDRPLLRAWSLVAGRLLGLVLVCVGAASLLAVVPQGGDQTLADSTPAAVVLGISGVALLVLAAYRWRRPSRPHASSHRFAHLPPWALLLGGAGLTLVSPTVLALFVPALHAIARSDAPEAGKLVALAVLVVAANLMLVLPVLLATLFGDRVRPALDRLEGWLEQHSATITLSMLVVFGTLMVALAGRDLLRG